LRLGIGADWTYLAATSSPFATRTTFTGFATPHNFAMGGALETNGQLDLGTYGRLVARSRHYILGVLDAQGSQEFIWYGRVAYDIDVARYVGIGVAPTAIHRRSAWRDQTVTQTSFDTQLYLRIHN
jgi:hypothetical protein